MSLSLLNPSQVVRTQRTLFTQSRSGLTIKDRSRLPRSIRLLDKPGVSDPGGEPTANTFGGISRNYGAGGGGQRAERAGQGVPFRPPRILLHWSRCSGEQRQRTLRQARWRGWLMRDHCIVWTCAAAGLSGCTTATVCPFGAPSGCIGRRRLATTCMGWPQAQRQAGRAGVAGLGTVGAARMCSTCNSRMARALL